MAGSKKSLSAPSSYSRLHASSAASCLARFVLLHGGDTTSRIRALGGSRMRHTWPKRSSRKSNLQGSARDERSATIVSTMRLAGIKMLQRSVEPYSSYSLAYNEAQNHVHT